MASEMTDFIKIEDDLPFSRLLQQLRDMVPPEEDLPEIQLDWPPYNSDLYNRRMVNQQPYEPEEAASIFQYPGAQEVLRQPRAAPYPQRAGRLASREEMVSQGIQTDDRLVIRRPRTSAQEGKLYSSLFRSGIIVHHYSGEIRVYLPRFFVDSMGLR